MDTSITFDNSVIAGYIVTGVLSMLMAAAVLLIWQKRTHEKLMPVIVGAVIFPVFALGLKIIPAYPLIFADTELAHTISGTPLLYYLVGGILAGVFEETGRFIAFRFLLKKHTGRRTAIAYGIGHGGFEAVYIGYQLVVIAVMGIMVNRGMLPELTKNLTAEQLPTALEQLQGFADTNVLNLLLGAVERAGALMLQIALSIVVFAAVRDKKRFWLYPLAVLLHAAIDFSIVFGKDHPLVLEIVFVSVSAAALFAALRLLYAKLPAEQEVQT